MLCIFFSHMVIDFGNGSFSIRKKWHKGTNLQAIGFLVLLQKICSLSRNSKFRILDIQISWRHQIPKHKTRNTFYWITWKVNSLLMKYGQFISYYKRRYQKITQNCVLITSSRPFCVSKKLSKSIEKWIFETSYLY